jgi:hypothetical protein
LTKKTKRVGYLVVSGECQKHSCKAVCTSNSCKGKQLERVKKMKSDIESATKILARDISKEFEGVGMNILTYIVARMTDPSFTNRSQASVVTVRWCIGTIRVNVMSAPDISKMIKAVLLAIPNEGRDFFSWTLNVLFQDTKPQPFFEGVVIGVMEACLSWGKECPPSILESLASVLKFVFDRGSPHFGLMSKEMAGRFSNLSASFMDLFGPITHGAFFNKLADSEYLVPNAVTDQIISELTLRAFQLQCLKKRVGIMNDYFSEDGK